MTVVPSREQVGVPHDDNNYTYLHKAFQAQPLVLSNTKRKCRIAVKTIDFIVETLDEGVMYLQTGQDT